MQFLLVIWRNSRKRPWSPCKSCIEINLGKALIENLKTWQVYIYVANCSLVTWFAREIILKSFRLYLWFVMWKFGQHGGDEWGRKMLLRHCQTTLEVFNTVPWAHLWFILWCKCRLQANLSRVSSIVAN